jgi:hypothetical protein
MSSNYTKIYSWATRSLPDPIVSHIAPQLKPTSTTLGILCTMIFTRSVLTNPHDIWMLEQRFALHPCEHIFRKVSKNMLQTRTSLSPVPLMLCTIEVIAALPTDWIALHLDRITLFQSSALERYAIGNAWPDNHSRVRHYPLSLLVVAAPDCRSDWPFNHSCHDEANKPQRWSNNFASTWIVSIPTLDTQGNRNTSHLLRVFCLKL